MHLVYLNKRPANRAERRAAQKEYDFVLKHLLPVELKFAKTIFDDDKCPAYNVHYEYSLDYFKICFDWLHLQRKLYYIIVNPHYFEQVYGPYWRKQC